MSGLSKQFHLPWHQNPHYWLTLYPVSGPFIGDIAQLLMRAGAKDIADGGMALRTGQQWKAVWDVLRNGLMGIDALEQVQVSLTYGDQAPYTRAEAGCQSAAAIQNIAEG
ncbi:MAG: hypothetical protein EBX37_14985, partial [Alphaproteobacteria bacterium]|nr:hypothetical protein [Alphaproteobacteria bacterium]